MRDFVHILTLCLTPSALLIATLWAVHTLYANGGLLP
jgi:hypothetical protein